MNDKQKQYKLVVDIFVSGLDLHADASERVDCVETIRGDLDVHSTNFVKFNANSHLYSAYHVEIAVSSSR